MARTARDNRPNVSPVQKIELNARHTKVRLALALLLLVFGAVMLCRALFGGPAVEAGWAEIEAAASGEPSCASDFTFLYPLGTTAAPAAERRALSELYGEACASAYRLFTNDAEFDGLANVRCLNAHPNEEFTLDPALYAAFEQIAASGDRSLYLAPIHEICDGILHLDDPAQAPEFDPRQNDDLRAWCASVCARANDPTQVNIALLGGNRARLEVSDEYLAWARREEIASFIDFNWMRNAFIADYLAGRLTAAGYRAGTLSSRDGFMRNLDEQGSAEYAVNILDRDGAGVHPAAVMRYRGARAIVNLRDYPATAADADRYCVLPGGEIRTPYLDARDGLCRTAPLTHDLTAYAESFGCAEILLRLIPVWISDETGPEPLLALSRDGIHSVYPSGGTVYHTQEDLALTNLADGYAAARAAGAD